MEESAEYGEEIESTEPDIGLDQPTYTLELLAFIKESQQQHGLRHGDYQRYRSYCSRRLRRIRKCVSLVQGVKQRFIQKKLLPENIKDVRCLYIPLVEAERCWSYAMQLKAESNEDHRKRYHMINKLRKAESYVLRLDELCSQVKCDARTKLEVQAYRAWMSGTLKFELKEWQSAMELLTKAKLIYDKLSAALSGDLALVYKQRVADIEPSIRYCAYNIGDTSAADDLVGIRLAMGHTDAALDELIQKTREKQAGSLHEITWRGRAIPVRNDKVRVFLLAEQESEREVEACADLDAKIDVYDRVIKDCVEALQLIKEELKSDPTFKQIQRGQTVEGRIPVQVMLHVYLQYIKLRKTIDRNLLMIASYKPLVGQAPKEGQRTVKAQDIARLYEIIIQNLMEIPTLPGLDEDNNLGEEIAADIVAKKASRCYYLALSYSTLKQWPEVVALCNRSGDYASQAQSAFNTSTPAELRQGIEEVLRGIDALLIRAQASSILDTQDLGKDFSKLSIAGDKRPIYERMDTYSECSGSDTSLIHMPPDMQPVPCKPLFFDLAYNHVQMPKLSHKVQAETKAGITGFVKSWIGGWGGKK